MGNQYISAVFSSSTDKGDVTRVKPFLWEQPLFTNCSTHAVTYFSWGKLEKRLIDKSGDLAMAVIVVSEQTSPCSLKFQLVE